ETSGLGPALYDGGQLFLAQPLDLRLGKDRLANELGHQLSRRGGPVTQNREVHMRHLPHRADAHAYAQGLQPFCDARRVQAPRTRLQERTGQRRQTGIFPVLADGSRGKEQAERDDRQPVRASEQHRKAVAERKTLDRREAEGPKRPWLGYEGSVGPHRRQAAASLSTRGRYRNTTELSAIRK